jgi:hypothetical protein
VLHTVCKSNSSDASDAIYDQLANRLHRDNIVTFTKCDVNSQKQIAESYNVTKCVTRKLATYRGS